MLVGHNAEGGAHLLMRPWLTKLAYSNKQTTEMHSVTHAYLSKLN